MSEKAFIPAGRSEADVVEAINKAANILAPSFAFAYHEVSDIRQQIALEALKALASGRYDPTRPLENFIYAHVRNRLINFKRDKLRRNDPPCPTCHRLIPGEHSEHEDGKKCEKYLAWAGRNTAKQNIIAPLDISNISDEAEPRTRTESEVEDNVITHELLLLIDESLDMELRADYLAMRSGAKVPKARRELVVAALREIVDTSEEED